MIAGVAGPDLTYALPSEYLARLALSNDLFGDDVRLEGIAREVGELVVFTSQPTIVGEAARPDEIIAFMEKRWLRRIGGEALGHAGALSFYRDLDQVAVFDAHPANVLKDDAGRILPIDLIAIRASESLAVQLDKLAPPI